jgi:hypothetical protein
MKKLNIAQSKNRFDYVAYDNEAKNQQAYFKEIFVNLCEKTVETLQQGRSLDLAVTALEEAYMWIGKAIRDDQIIRNGATELEEDRSNS